MSFAPRWFMPKSKNIFFTVLSSPWAIGSSGPLSVTLAGRMMIMKLYGILLVVHIDDFANPEWLLITNRSVWSYVTRQPTNRPMLTSLTALSFPCFSHIRILVLSETIVQLDAQNRGQKSHHIGCGMVRRMKCIVIVPYLSCWQLETYCNLPVQWVTIHENMIVLNKSRRSIESELVDLFLISHGCQ